MPVRPAVFGIRAKVLPTSGDDNGFGLLGTLSVSKVLIKSSAWVAVGLLGLQPAGVEGLDIRLISGARVYLEL